ncbi:MAG: hypothetical protein HN406_34775, partial [Lentisphaerae bacterium]|nr:hypothetical protein [Lentisphaerota bacterium]
MRTTFVPSLAALVVTATACWARDPTAVNPPFPRIGTCYGTGLGWKNWEQGKKWWSKVDLVFGGCYDLHYDWEHPRWKRVLANVEENLKQLRRINPDCLVLPYVDVVEGPDNPNLPQHWWSLKDGERWSGWPGFFRINTDLPDVLQFNLDKTREEIFTRNMFDGVFYDCWAPDDWLVPRTAQLRNGKAIVTLNCWNLPTTGFAHLNGCLAEDEINRVVEGKVDFEDFLARYLRWCRESRRPVATMLVCHPRTTREDPWANAKRTREERQALIRKARTADPQMMRFGLTTALMGDGYFSYDGGNGLSRGNWWWYPEYDAPLGYPKSPAHRREDGLWERRFDGGVVLVNGSNYDAAVRVPTNSRDVSTGRVGTQFTIPMYDGRIFLPTDAAPSPGGDTPPRLAREASRPLEAARLSDHLLVARTARGLELRFDRAGKPTHILLHGRTVMTGGWPVICNHPMHQYQPESLTEPTIDVSSQEVTFAFKGQLVEGGKRISYTQTASLTPRNQFSLRYTFTVEDALDLRMWRHYFFFPVSQFAGGEAKAEGRQIVLPETLGDDKLLPSATQVTIAGPHARIAVTSSVPLGLVDHRKWGSADFLLAG